MKKSVILLFSLILPLMALPAQMAEDSGFRPDALGSCPNANQTSSVLFAMALPAAPVIDWYAMEEPWTFQTGGYSSGPEGDAIAISLEVLDFLSK